MTAEGQAAAMVAAVRDDPVRRLELAVGFYDRRTGAPGVRSDRRAELAFMRWVQFLRQPSPRAWYLAHNASIVAGYLAHRDLAEREQQLERFFMDVALIRVLYAHSLLTAPRLALGRLARAGRLLGDPRWRGADMGSPCMDHRAGTGSRRAPDEAN